MLILLRDKYQFLVAQMFKIMPYYKGFLKK